MKRPPHPTLLATMALLGCEPRFGVEAPITIEDQPEGEPSGRADKTEPGAAKASKGIPEAREWCGAIIDTRPRPLMRTSSFLLAWNEIRTASGRTPEGPIPLNEHDARLTICGNPTCEPTIPRPIEFNEGGKISIGTVIQGGPELLVIPDLSPFFGPTQCSGSTDMTMQMLGEHMQVTAVTRPRSYHHHHGYYGCYAGQGRHDVFADLATGMVVLEIEHRSTPLGVSAEARDGLLHVTLSGCESKLELRWTK